MQDLLKSFTSLSLALTLFGFKQGENVFYSADRPDRRSQATLSMDSLTNATVQQLGGTLRATFDAMDNLQRGFISLAANVLWPTGGHSRGRSDYNRVTETFDDSSVRPATDWPYESRAKSRFRVAPDEYVETTGSKVCH